VKAIAEGIIEKLSSHGIHLGHKEGYEESRWILLDYGDVIVHIFYSEIRSFYGLERLWGDAPQVVFKP
jgi:ribosome-associated protein